MQSNSKMETDITSPRSSRAASINSDFSPMSASAYNLLSGVSPSPAYVAVSAASQIVTDHINAQLRAKFGLDSSTSPFGDVALFSEDALALVNTFLDNLLYTILATAKSASLTAIRPAVVDVLKARLARPAIESADQELQDLLAGEDEDDEDEAETDTQGGRTAKKFDLEGVWKRTRLRVMVYTRLGEMEDEDEEQYLDQIDGEDGLELDQKGLVSWSAAIFLTAVIEYVAEQAIAVAGNSAFTKKKKRSIRNANAENSNERLRIEEDSLDPADRMTVDEGDVEKVALSSNLGRLWRTWRKRLRPTVAPPLTSPRNSIFRHRSAATNSLTGRRSIDGADNSVYEEEEGRRLSMDRTIETEPTETDIAANIPLPITENDIAEIVVPGLAKPIDDETDGTNTPVRKASGRPNSVMLLSPVEFGSREKAPRPYSMPPPAIAPLDTALASAAEDAEMKSAPAPKSGAKTEEDSERPVVTASTSSRVSYTTAPTDEDTATLRAPTEDKSDDDRSPLGKLEDAGEYPEVVKSQRVSLQPLPASPHVVQVAVGEHSPTLDPIEQTRVYDDEDAEDHRMPSDDGEGIGVAKTSNIPIASRDVGTSELDAQLDEAAAGDGASQSISSPSASARKSPLTIETDNSAEHQNPATYTGIPSRGGVLSPVKETTNSAEEVANLKPSGSRPLKHKHNKSRSSRKSRSQTPEEASGISRQSADSSGAERNALARLSSGSDSIAGRARGLSSRMSQEEREREFDSLLKGDETVKLTLTPQSMRDLESKNMAAAAPVARNRDSKSVTKITVYPPQTASTNGAKHAPSPLSVRTNSLPQQPETYGSPVSPIDSMPPLPLPQHQNKIRKTRPNVAAREPRVQGESLRDFADFIRSTGPTREEPSQQKEIQIPAKMMGLSGLARKASGRISTSHSNASDGPTARPRMHLEARSPAVSKTNGTAELSDFLREGPPAAGRGRNTFDSDDYTVSSTAASTKPSTINSRTGLISSQQQQQQSAGAYGAEPQIVRTRRRVKDPYAIDTDSEDEDLDEALLSMPPSKHRGRQEESLIDFLRNTEPPRNNDPAPLSPNGSAAVAAAASRSATVPVPGHAGAGAGGSRSPRSPAPRSATIPVPGAHSSSNGLPPASPLKSPLAPLRSPLSPASQERLGLAGAYSSGLPRGAVARDPNGLSRSSTSDLADFLRNSGPTVPPPSAGASSIQGPVGLGRRESGRGDGGSKVGIAGMSRFFARKKSNNAGFVYP